MTTRLSPEIDHVRSLLPAVLAAHPEVAALLDRAAVVLHGSRTIGIDDHAADVDLWVLTDDATRARFASAAGASFVDFRVAGPGHFQVESVADLRRRATACDMELISELRHGVVLADPTGIARELMSAASSPMPQAVRLAWLAYHYVEMRSEHRTCDGAIERGSAIAMLLSASRVLQHAMQAAMVLDGEPYRYSKWLAQMASRTPTGAKIVPLVQNAVAVIDSGALRIARPQAAHPLDRAIREIRAALMESAAAAGIDQPWLREWWLHIDKARAGIHDVSW